MTPGLPSGQPAGPERQAWPRGPVPPHTPGWSAVLHQARDLATTRSSLRAYLHAAGHGDGDAAAGPAELDEAGERVLLAADEMVSNGVRHGRPPTSIAVARPRLPGHHLLTVTDQAPGSAPAPDPDRDPSRGGLGLTIIARLSADHGWWPGTDTKTVWALLPTTAG